MGKKNVSRNHFMLKGALARKGYDWWWHNFSGRSRQTGEERSFFIEYFICNPALGGKEPILGQLPSNRDQNIRPSYAMVKAGTWGTPGVQVNNFYGIDDFFYSDAPFAIEIGDNILSEDRLTGSCSITPAEAAGHPEYMSDAGSLSWDLEVDKKLSFHVGYGASHLFRTLNAFEMFWHAQGIKTTYSGTITYNDEVFDILPETSFGYADKNWGSDFTSPWLWISSCHMKSLITGDVLNHSALEFGGGRPKVFSHPLDRKILGCVYYKGKKYEYNFSKVHTKSKVKFAFDESGDVNTWKILARNHNSLVELKLFCPKEEMLFMNYESPDGAKRHNRLWNGGTGYGEMRIYKLRNGKKYMVDHVKIYHAGCEYGEYGDSFQ